MCKATEDTAYLLLLLQTIHVLRAVLRSVQLVYSHRASPPEKKNVFNKHLKHLVYA